MILVQVSGAPVALRKVDLQTTTVTSLNTIDNYHILETCYLPSHSARNRFTNNVASLGGGAYMFQSHTVRVFESNFTGNSATSGHGGGFYAVSDDIILREPVNHALNAGSNECDRIESACFYIM